ncbi:MAG TPA: M48 family metallopeptidase [Acidimicrobiales bacterium]|nr:M48 family metallopeptidase [Acidimicrobiales bacterium]
MLPSHWRRLPADAAEWFDAAEIARGRRYNRPLERLGRVRLAASVAVVSAFVAGRAGPRLLDALPAQSWPVQVVVVAFALQATSLVYAPWFAAHRALVYDKWWGLSTQTPRGFLRDQLTQLALGGVATAVLVVPLYAVIRTTEWWWLFGWMVVAGVTVGLGFVWPVLVAPLFNRFRPLDDATLAERLRAVASRAGLDVDEVLVADASRRSRAGNAYVAGLGRTRRVVIFDTIVDWPPELVEQVVAHELGHWRHAHLRRRLPVVLAAQLLVFGVAWALLRQPAVLRAAGVEAAGDPASLPLLVGVLSLGLGATSLLTSWLSRADERQADLFALEVLQRPDRLTAVLRRLARCNRADVDPSWWKRLWASHPPLAERMALARAWEQARVPGSG